MSFVTAHSGALVHAVCLVVHEFTTRCHITSDLVRARAGVRVCVCVRARVCAVLVCTCVELVEWKS